MNLDSALPLLLAQQTNIPESAESWANILTNIAWVIIVACVCALPFLLGNWIARALRVPDYRNKIGVILFSVFLALLVIAPKYRLTVQPEGEDYTYRVVQATDAIQWPPKLGIDLKGGVILIYELKSGELPGRVGEDAGDPGGLLEAEGDEDDADMNGLITALSRRLNPTGTKEIVIRPYGDRQVEIIIPDVDEVEIEQAKRLITEAGALEFRIVANEIDHASIIDLARERAQDPNVALAQTVRDEDGNAVGFWALVGREDNAIRGGVKPLKLEVIGSTIRDAETGRWITTRAVDELENEIVVPQEAFPAENQPGRFERWLAREGIEDVQILMAIDDPYNITGSDLNPGNVAAGADEYGAPAVHFGMDSRGAIKMRNLTANNLPDEDRNLRRQLGILLDDVLLSAPVIQSTISDQGIIQGRFTQEEVDFLVEILRAGSLPAALEEQPISENKIGAILGADTIVKGSYAMVVSMILVLVFILFYYRFSGIVACVALLANLLLIVATMILIRATLTLPGLAGLVLTVGMSVDANVLIYERIREELNRGAALRMAIRNGFSRATTTIVDANVTTLITAVVLYVIGTDQIRGFSVTLILGILMSMFTAIFWARVVFDIAERKRWIAKLNMMQMLGATQIDFMRWWKPAAAASLVVMAISIGAVAARQERIFDIDFLGGTSLHVQLREPMEVATMRQKLDAAFEDVMVEGASVSYSLTQMDVADQPENTMFKIDSSIQEVERLQEVVREALVNEQGETLLATYELETEVLGPGEGAPAPNRQSSRSAPEDEEHSRASLPRRSDLPPNNVLALAGDDGLLLAQAGPKAKKTEAEDRQEPAADATPAPAATGPALRTTRARLTFAHEIAPDSLRQELRAAAEELEVPLSVIQILETEKTADGQVHTVALGATQETTTRLLNHLEQRFDGLPVWPSSSKIGSQVAGNTQAMAIAALLASLVGIIAYLWIRFQRVMYGLAAVAALIHDVVITLGAIALSFWVADALGFLLIEEFKISLAVVAALLTVIGYSLNDTIVIFDRIREVRGKSPDLDGAMINTSVNQTLSRTLLTSFTTLIVVVVLYIMGGQGIHGFAFTLLVGIFAGTYSTVFIASPILLWMSQGKKDEATVAKTTAKSLSA